MYQLTKKEPRWIVLVPAVKAQRATKEREAVRAVPAVEGLFAPITSAMKRRAGRAAMKALAIADLDCLSDDQKIDLGEAVGRELVREGLRDMRGVAGANGAALAFSAEVLELVIEDETLMAAADRLYVLPAALRDKEKNASSGSPDGTGTGAMPADAIAS